jgi:hypothetical protein
MRRWLAWFSGVAGGFVLGLSPAIGWLSGSFLNMCIAAGLGAALIAIEARMCRGPHK